MNLDMAERLESSYGWDDIVLRSDVEKQLRDLTGQARGQTKVIEKWGFGQLHPRAGGISALFSGLPGTGKTMAAEVIARDLGLELYSIDLSQVVSKYIGETERNLRRVFDAAHGSGAILLFDEADALFGKRSGIRDYHDRYANVEVSYLLDRMEEYRGVAILTSNMRSDLDDAFLRRLRFVIEFPHPDAEERRRIWENVFPRKAPTRRLDYGSLAELELTGGEIRNAAFSAAFRAAAAGKPIRMEHIREVLEARKQGPKSEYEDLKDDYAVALAEVLRDIGDALARIQDLLADEARLDSSTTRRSRETTRTP